MHIFSKSQAGIEVIRAEAIDSMRPNRSVSRMLSILLTILAISGATLGQVPQQTSKQTADLVIRAGAIHTMAQGRPTMRSIAIGGGKILAVGDAAHDLDGFIGGSTQVIDDPTLTLLPGFIDTPLTQAVVRDEQRRIAALEVKAHQ